LIRNGARLAAGVAGVGILARSAIASSPLPLRLRADIGFGDAAARNDWSDGRYEWLGVLGARVTGVEGGAAFLELPHGSQHSASAQPCPVFLLDRDCSVLHQELVFSVTTDSAGVGLLWGATSTTSYSSVTVAADWAARSL
jgi:hypothetical protein